MSSSPESKNPNLGPAQGAVSPYIGVPAPQPKEVLNTSSATPDDSAKFKTENIGQWAARQEGYFADQNHQAEVKRQKSEHTRKKVLPPVLIVSGIVIVGLIVWGVIALVKRPEPDVPTIAGGTVEDVKDYQDILQGFFNKDGGDNLAAVEEAVNNTLETNSGKEYADQVRLAELYLLQNNGYYTEVLDKAQNINVDSLDLSQKISFYGVLYYCNTLLGDQEKANEYMRIQYELSKEQGGTGGGS